jgi:hypothetical protein
MVTNVLKALASVISMCGIHVILLSKITPRYFAWLTKGIFLPFSVRWASGGLNLWVKKMSWVLSQSNFTFQSSLHVSVVLRPRCSFVRRIYIQVSSAKRPRETPGVWGVWFIYRLYNVRDRTEPCSSSACISLGLDISHSTDTLKFLWHRIKLIRLIKLIENFKLDNVYGNPMCHVVSKAFFNIQEYHSRRHVIVEM